MTASALRAHPLGDSAVTIAFGTVRSAELLTRIHAAARALETARIPHVEDVVPAYLALTVFYNAIEASYDEIAKTLLDVCDRPLHRTTKAPEAREHVIPVHYDGTDLDAVAASTGLSVTDVIARHCGRTYSVDLLGFVPGWAYLSELDPSLQLPRRSEPRPRVPAGSVAIAAAQTGVYPLDTPGGWHIIGRTETVMFDPAHEPPALLRPGDVVRFESVT